jgi:hypothetical protein
MEKEDIIRRTEDDLNRTRNTLDGRDVCVCVCVCVCVRESEYVCVCVCVCVCRCRCVSDTIIIHVYTYTHTHRAEMEIMQSREIQAREDVLHRTNRKLNEVRLYIYLYIMSVCECFCIHCLHIYESTLTHSHTHTLTHTHAHLGERPQDQAGLPCRPSIRRKQSPTQRHGECACGLRAGDA